RRVARRASSAVRALSCAARSSAREVRWPRTPRVHCQETWTSAACRPCPTSLAAVIVVVAKTVSKEFGSDLDRVRSARKLDWPIRRLLSFRGMNDVTSTTFGLIIGFLLPGVAGLWALGPWFPPVATAFAKVQDAKTDIGLSLLGLMAALGTGLIVTLFRWLLFEQLFCRRHCLGTNDFE